VPDYLVQDFVQQHGQALGLECVAGTTGFSRRICAPEIYRPGLALAGYLKDHPSQPLLVFGKVELEYLHELAPQERTQRLRPLLLPTTPAVIVAESHLSPSELISLCEEVGLPLFCASLSTVRLLNKMMMLLTEEFSPSLTCHGTLVDIFGVGVLIQGDPSVGKSEAALGLIERGHRLISDDVVKIRRREDRYLEGMGIDPTRHHMEIRGIGIIDVVSLYGAACVCNAKVVDLVVRLEGWSEGSFYDRACSEGQYKEILDVNLPFHTLPVKPGRDVVLLLETIALNQRLKEMRLDTRPSSMHLLQDRS
jgi:HPr kinase/phosphorylase